METIETPNRLIPDMKPAIEDVRSSAKKVGDAAAKVGQAADRLDAAAHKKAMIDGGIITAVVLIVLYLVVEKWRGK